MQIYCSYPPSIEHTAICGDPKVTSCNVLGEQLYSAVIWRNLITTKIMFLRILTVLIYSFYLVLLVMITFIQVLTEHVKNFNIR